MPHLPKYLTDLEEKLKPYVLGSQTRFSAKGVPHLVVWNFTITYSLCFFGRSRTWRLFFPYPSAGGIQTRKDFPTIDSIVEFFKNLKK